jgi:2-isopropylmalate synthase
MSEKIYIFDSTLRDGQQCPGAGMSFENNLLYAQLAQKLGVDVLEAGFPAASKLDFEIVNAIAKQLAADSNNQTTVAALCQLRSEQVDKTIEALWPALKQKKARLHVYLPVDPQLMLASLGEERAKDRLGLFKDLEEFISQAVKVGMEVEFSPEGYSRQGSNFDFVTDLLRVAVSAGASVINCPDTIGGAAQYEGKDYFVEKMKLHSKIIAEEFPKSKVIWSAHCHNDFGLALTNSLNAVFDGPARQIEGCFNGIGERAGNVALEQCIMVIKHFGSKLKENFFTDVKTEHLREVSDFISSHMLPRQPHFPVVGDNAMKHSSGGHTNAILKNPLVYQPFDPAEIGTAISFSFGPLSGGNHAKSIIEDSGFICSENEKAQIAQFIKDSYKDRRKGITDDELIAAYVEYRKPISVENFSYAKNEGTASVTLEGKFFDLQSPTSYQIQGKDSALAALKALIDNHIQGLEILSHKSESAGKGTSASSVSHIIILSPSGEKFSGRGEDQDIEISAMKALVDASNKAFVHSIYKKWADKNDSSQKENKKETIKNENSF